MTKFNHDTVLYTHLLLSYNYLLICYNYHTRQSVFQVQSVVGNVAKLVCSNRFHVSIDMYTQRTCTVQFPLPLPFCPGEQPSACWPLGQIRFVADGGRVSRGWQEDVPEVGRGEREF